MSREFSHVQFIMQGGRLQTSIQSSHAPVLSKIMLTKKNLQGGIFKLQDG